MLVKAMTKYKQNLLKQYDESNQESKFKILYDQTNEQIRQCYNEGILETDEETLQRFRIDFLLEINEKQEAIYFTDKYIEKYPKNVEGYQYKANILFEEKKFEQIIELYDQAIFHSPTNFQLQYEKALYLEKQERWVDALKCINLALKISPQSLHLYLQKFQSLAQLNHFKKARQCCRMIPNLYYDTDQEMAQCDF
ncbi:unnamed protein product [Paramecium sonneborni]|uniref:Tetratricopeptide repeat protein n=1 Tax=Paramecium sonneborni TaxID=65129 RepID=A0A8S1M7A0_9CILI|nr:unnamed protein product [Paramecium sonneborni]